MRKYGNHAAIAVFVGIASLAIAPVASGEDLREAHKSEIERYVGQNTRLTKLSDGYSYKSGSRNGYRFDNGEICVRFRSGSSDCVKVLTDGKKFYMVTKDGDRSRF